MEQCSIKGGWQSGLGWSFLAKRRKISHCSFQSVLFYLRGFERVFDWRGISLPGPLGGLDFCLLFGRRKSFRVDLVLPPFPLVELEQSD